MDGKYRLFLQKNVHIVKERKKNTASKYANYCYNSTRLLINL